MDCPSCGTKTTVPSKEAILRRQDRPLHPELYLKSDEELPAFELRRRKSEEDEMDLTPMVDVTFQLLIFFIFTASLSLQKAIDVPTPDPENKGAQQSPVPLEELEQTSIIVEIEADNTIIIDDEVLEDRGQLASTLAEQMRFSGNSEMMIKASADSFHETTVAVYDAANEVGMQKIRQVVTAGAGEE